MVTQQATTQKMKYSGVEWIGDIPAGWEAKPLLSYFDISKSKVSEGLLPPLSVGYMGVVPQLKEVAQNIAEGERKHVERGDLVINSRSDRMGAAGLSVYEGGVSLVYHVLRPRGSVVGKYFHYILRNAMFSQEFYKNGQGIVGDLWSTKDSVLKRISVPIPPQETQKEIVDFLDEKTEKIDQIIEKKKKLIELLKEKRSSLITHAVTKGLDPNAKMKDSGVEWIGEIPEEWEALKLKFCFDSLTRLGAIGKQISLENIEGWTGYFIESNSDYGGIGVQFKAKDLLFGKLRPYLAKSFFAQERGTAGGDILVYRAKEHIYPKFGFYSFLSHGFVNAVDSHTYGVKMPRANPLIINSLPFVYPKNKDEQIEISSFLDEKTGQIDKTIQKIQSQINKLQEYRASLIYHTVTGKIKV